jgi:AraC-like DNA-binding protein
MSVVRYGTQGSALTPNLFTHTRGFSFTRPNGSLVHRLLRPGPKGFQAIAVASTGHTAEFVERSRIAITVPLRGQAVVDVGTRRHCERPGDVMVLGPGERRSHLAPDDSVRLYESFTVIAPSTWSIRMREECVHRPPGDHGRRLVGLLEFAFAFLNGDGRQISRAVMLGEALLEEALSALVTDCTIDGSNPSTPEIVARAACDFMQEHYNRPITAADVAAASGVGVRTLQRAFVACRNTTLWTYLTALRLDAMRRVLEAPQPGTSVTSAALDSGLFHLGRCSAAFLARFGELPSQTLSRGDRTNSGRRRKRHRGLPA